MSLLGEERSKVRNGFVGNIRIITTNVGSSGGDTGRDRSRERHDIDDFRIVVGHFTSDPKNSMSPPYPRSS